MSSSIEADVAALMCLHFNLYQKCGFQTMHSFQIVLMDQVKPEQWWIIYFFLFIILTYDAHLV